jgi:hypothetical protein
MTKLIALTISLLSIASPVQASMTTAELNAAANNWQNATGLSNEAKANYRAGMANHHGERKSSGRTTTYTEYDLRREQQNRIKLGGGQVQVRPSIQEAIMNSIVK